MINNTSDYGVSVSVSSFGMAEEAFVNEFMHERRGHEKLIVLLGEIFDQYDSNNRPFNNYIINFDNLDDLLDFYREASLFMQQIRNNPDFPKQEMSPRVALVKAKYDIEE